MGMHLRVIAPASPLSVISPPIQDAAIQALHGFGFTVSVGKNAHTKSAVVSDRVEDIHAALADPNVTHLMAAIGGWNSHELLPYIDWDLWRRNPKPLIGYSDITAVQNALYSICGVPSIHGPAFSTFGQPSHLTYSANQLCRCIHGGPYTLDPANEWLDDRWYEEEGPRQAQPSTGYRIVFPGRADGVVIGGNLSTLMLLAGTPYFPPLAGTLVCIEEAGAVQPQVFRRWIHQLSQMPDGRSIRGFLVGRFSRNCSINEAELFEIFQSAGYADVPIVCNASFGHTYPVGSFPIGGRAIVIADGMQQSVSISISWAPA